MLHALHGQTHGVPNFGLPSCPDLVVHLDDGAAGLAPLHEEVEVLQTQCPVGERHRGSHRPNPNEIVSHATTCEFGWNETCKTSPELFRHARVTQSPAIDKLNMIYFNRELNTTI